MIGHSNWFTERAPDFESAFSLKFKKKLHQEQTPYQYIEIYETEGFGNLLVLDGFVMLSSKDNFFYHEMISHPVLFTHPNPKIIWIIGGGDCGTLKEVLKHDKVEQVVQIEIDERVTRLAEKYFPELCSSNNDPRAHLIFVDGIEWIKKAEPGSTDIIIIDCTDPIGPAKGLFSKEFYNDCYNALSEKGILVQQSESPVFHIQILEEMHKAMKSSGFTYLNPLFFPQCVYPSGWWSATTASKSDLSQFREIDSASKNFLTHYYNVEIHRAALAKPEFFKRAMAEW